MNSPPKITSGDGFLAVRLNNAYKSIASTLYNGGLKQVSGILFRQVEECGMECLEEEYSVKLISESGMEPGKTALFLTGADLPEWSIVKKVDVNSNTVYTIVTAGFKGIACTSGIEEQEDVGTINIAVIFDGCLQDPGAVELASMVASARTAALGDFLLGCGPGKGRAYATVTDSILVAYRECSGNRFTGPLTPLGKSVFYAVYKSIIELARKIGSEKRFKHVTGITIDDLLDIALEFYSKAPVPGVDEEGVKKVLRDIISNALEDPNVWLLLMASRSLDDIGVSGSIPYLSRENYLADYKGIVADELLGIALSIYLNGWKGLFAYYWIDRTKKSDSLPGSLPMFMDDIIGALLGGCLSKLYDKYVHR